MESFSHGRTSQQFRFLRRQFLQDGKLPFTNVLTVETITQALEKIDACWKDRIYTPLVTLSVFLGQVLNADHSCRAAVARLIAQLLSQGDSPCCPETGAYCQARKRLPEAFFSAVACEVGRNLDSNINAGWLWKGRRVYMFDGSTVSMPDTQENQSEYPQVYNQKPGLGFPIARIAAIISLSCGAILSLGICRYAGKGQGEVSLLRQMWDLFRPGDVLLTDCLLSAWVDLVMLKQRGVDSVTRLNKARRTADFRRGKRLGKDDHIVQWPKPMKPRSIDSEIYRSLPDYLPVREIRVRVEQPGLYRGQCTELCGRLHGFMPIVVEVKEQADFDAWYAERQAAAQRISDAASQTFTMEQLMAQGQTVYNTYCMACHQANGQGLPPAFPALTGSAIATGPAADHINIVLNGKQGTAMAAFGTQLSAVDIASVITFERNALGNSVGDMVQPVDIVQAQAQ